MPGLAIKEVPPDFLVLQRPRAFKRPRAIQTDRKGMIMGTPQERIKAAVKSVREAEELIARIEAKAGELDRQKPESLEVLEARRRGIVADLALDDNENGRAALEAVSRELAEAEKKNRDLLELRAGIADKLAEAQGAREMAINKHRDEFFPYLQNQAIALNKQYFSAATELVKAFKRLYALGELCKSHAVGFSTGAEHSNLSIPLFNLDPTDTGAIRTVDGKWFETEGVRHNPGASLIPELDSMKEELRQLGLTI